MFTILDTDNNAYTEYYKRLKARGNVPSGYAGVVHHHHFRLEKDTLRDDNDFIECTMEEHTELHKLMYECYPCNTTSACYNFIKGWCNCSGKHRTFTEEHKRKLSKPKSEEHRKHLSEALKGKYCGKNHPMYGKHHSEESKQKNIEAQHRTPVGMFDYATDKLIKSFMGKREAERELGKHITVYNNKPKRNGTGYYFKHL